jgi:hypothetical protein
VPGFLAHHPLLGTRQASFGMTVNRNPRFPERSGGVLLGRDARREACRGWTPAEGHARGGGCGAGSEISLGRKGVPRSAAKESGTAGESILSSFCRTPRPGEPGRRGFTMRICCETTMDALVAFQTHYCEHSPALMRRHAA